MSKYQHQRKPITENTRSQINTWAPTDKHFLARFSKQVTHLIPSHFVGSRHTISFGTISLLDLRSKQVFLRVKAQAKHS